MKTTIHIKIEAITENTKYCSVSCPFFNHSKYEGFYCNAFHDYLEHETEPLTNHYIPLRLLACIQNEIKD